MPRQETDGAKKLPTQTLKHKWYNSFMKRLVFCVITTLALLFGLAPSAAANVNNFTISDYKIEMTLDRDSEGRSTLQTVETITAQFPDFDQNRGLERAIPKRYDGHSTSLRIESVTDRQGAPRVYSEYTDDNGNLVVRMADMSKYVHGEQTYRLTYTQRDVTRYFRDTNSDEFYWDTNGTGWRVPIARLQVDLAVADRIQKETTGQRACYVGATGSTTRCELTQNGARYTTTGQSLAPGQNITIAIGFEPGTFSGYQMTFWEIAMLVWLILQGILLMAGTIAVVWIGISVYRTLNRTRELHPIAPEYLPPPGTSVTAAAAILPQTTGSVMTAQLLDLAVRHYIRIYEVAEKKWHRPAEYEIEITKDPSTLAAEEQELLSDSFGSLPSVGQRLNLKSLQNNVGYYQRTFDNDTKLKQLVRTTYGLRERDTGLTTKLRRGAVVPLILSVPLLSPILPVVSGILFILSLTTWRLTDKGLALRRYLEGLKLYIKVGEEERLRMLQSPEGAAKIATGSSDEDPARRLVNLYERTLPYAVLFGQEKEWSKQLGTYYEQAGTQPDWYTGHAAFNAVAFSAGMSGLSQAASYASSSSSSSGGSSGGGSSGGGGGGGGGGGV